MRRAGLGHALLEQREPDVPVDCCRRLSSSVLKPHAVIDDLEGHDPRASTEPDG